MRFIRRFTNPNRSKKPSSSSFHQQHIRGCRPRLTPCYVIMIFTFMALLMIALCIPLFFAWNETRETKSYRYDNKCKINKECRIDIEIKKALRGPVFFYYEIHNYHQNHRSFVRSRSDFQLRERYYSNKYDDLQSCLPAISKDDDDDKKNSFLPCGLGPRGLFNDTFRMYRSNGKTVPWRNDKIIYPEEKYKFRNPPSDRVGIRVIKNYRDHDFIVWMRYNSFSDYRKLYRIINQKIMPGNYTVRIDNKWPVKKFDGEKYFVLAETSWIGQKNLGIAIAFAVVAAMSILIVLLFLLTNICFRRKIGDTSNLKWFKRSWF
eukprot:TRINITY_DN11319_c0_g1_i1.p1 TRINITY_DN11319_c0_g1~~TRINITY_DN11319_c0_g1_i1.p1  ORF type:complete len:319 (-),score=100.56 TRINITY_DN11319_c0_g1_i1:89-1045(-)